MASDFWNLLPRYCRDYWYVLLFLILMVVMMEYMYRLTQKIHEKGKINYPIQILLFLVGLILTVIGARGGLQNKPISPLTAIEYVDINLTPLVTNTPFTMMHTIEQNSLQKLSFFNAQDINNVFSLCKHNKERKPIHKMNIVIIILESFSKEFIGSLNNYKGYTPFLDSLINHSIVCCNAYADAEQSNKGIPCIITGLPNLMDKEYFNSIYQSNCQPSIASYLKKIGYHTSFFHGGTNGTMNFDIFSRSVGFDHYYGRNEYNDDKDYDGAWGIRDEEFFQYFASQLNTFPQPFCSAIFSLSSHHPYIIPEKYKGKFPKGPEEIIESIGYTDYALKMFFEKISKQPWYKNTFFVITADHAFNTVKHVNSLYDNFVRRNSIPILFFNPDQNERVNINHLSKQIDILPTILNYIGYEDDFPSFGDDILNKTAKHYVYRVVNNIYYIHDDRYLLIFNTQEGSVAFLDYISDSQLSKNILNTGIKNQKELEDEMKAVLQTYNDVMINNSLCKK